MGDADPATTHTSPIIDGASPAVARLLPTAYKGNPRMAIANTPHRPACPLDEIPSPPVAFAPYRPASRPNATAPMQIKDAVTARSGPYQRSQCACGQMPTARAAASGRRLEGAPAVPIVATHFNHRVSGTSPPWPELGPLSARLQSSVVQRSPTGSPTTAHTSTAVYHQGAATVASGTEVLTIAQAGRPKSPVAAITARTAGTRHGPKRGLGIAVDRVGSPPFMHTNPLNIKPIPKIVELTRPPGKPAQFRDIGFPRRSRTWSTQSQRNRPGRVASV